MQVQRLNDSQPVKWFSVEKTRYIPILRTKPEYNNNIMKWHLQNTVYGFPQGVQS